MNTLQQLNELSPDLQEQLNSHNTLQDLAPFTDTAFFDFDQFQSEPQLKLDLQHQYNLQMGSTTAATTSTTTTASDLLTLPESINHIFTTPVVLHQDEEQQQNTKKQKISTPVTLKEEDDHQVPEADKKKRNTAASARFRNKKKLREMEMERQVRLLSERVNTFNQRINQLETENACLKSLILEKNEQKSNNLLKSIKEKSLTTEQL